KGGDLHTHLAGGVYAERFIAWGAQEHLCADLAHVLLSKPQCDQPGDVPVADALKNQELYDRLVNAFSTRAFVPTLAVPTDHDKFFAAFGKFAAASGSHLVEMTIDQLKEYHSENVQYVEFMTSFECPDDRDKFIRRWPSSPTTRRDSRLCKPTASTNASPPSAATSPPTSTRSEASWPATRNARGRAAGSRSASSRRSRATVPSTTCSCRPPLRRR